jgi:hypothetical protein
VAAVIAAIALTGYLYRRSQGLPRWVHISLAAARLAVLCIVVVALFEPAAVVSRPRDLKRRLNVLIDVSESMSVKDQRKRPEDIVEASVALGILPASATEDASRAAVELDAEQRRTIAGASRLDLATRILSRSARDVFESIGDDLESIGDDLDVSYYAFGEKLYALSDEGSDLDGLEATKPGTSMAASLDAVAKADRGVPLAGIVLLTDGLDTSSRRTEGVVHDLGMRGIPVFPVPIGIADPDDVSIRNTIIQEVAFSGDKVPVRVQIPRFSPGVMRNGSPTSSCGSMGGPSRGEASRSKAACSSRTSSSTSTCIRREWPRSRSRSSRSPTRRRPTTTWSSAASE